MSSHSVHFPLTAAPIQHNESAPSAPKTPAKKTPPLPACKVELCPKPTALTALHQCFVHSKTIADTLKYLMASENKHGDLQAIRSAALNLIANADVLIEAEEKS